MDDIQMKANGLHSGTVIRERDIGNGVREQYHEYPETGEVIVLHTWFVPDCDCVSSEFEVISVYPKREGFANSIRAMESLLRSIDNHCDRMKELFHA